MANKNKSINSKYAPLYASPATIRTHWTLLAAELDRVLPKDGVKYVINEVVISGIRGYLLSDAFRYQSAMRSRGGSTTIAPLLDEDHTKECYWLSLYQSWIASPAGSGSRSFFYGTTSITVYFGSPETDDKLQLFRAEWPGIGVQRLGDFERFVFEAPGAGHPHWQFDAYQDRAEEVEKERNRLEQLSRTLNELLPQVEDFGQTIISEAAPGARFKRHKCMEQINRVHFASFADWSSQCWEGDKTRTESHARGPTSTKEILNWAVSTLVYLQSELGR